VSFAWRTLLLALIVTPFRFPAGRERASERERERAREREREREMDCVCTRVCVLTHTHTHTHTGICSTLCMKKLLQRA
jgi:hypothetical protein